MKQRLFYLFKKNNSGQIIFLIVSLVLILFIFFVIILGTLTSSTLQFSYVFRNFISLNSLTISGLRYVLWIIQQDPMVTTSEITINMLQGKFSYSIYNSNTTTKNILVTASLRNSTLIKILKATVTLDNMGNIQDIEVREE